jgi:hypothetical protein
VLKQAHIPYILAFHLKIDADPGQVPDPAYHFDADPDADSEFSLMRIHNTDGTTVQYFASVMINGKRIREY